jgi:hypothetical protein
MDRKTLLEAFARMSPEDQAAVRAALLEKETAAADSACCPEGMKEMMARMMGTMQAGEGPMAACLEMMEKMGGKGC